MKRAKQALCVLLATTFLMSLVACGGGKRDTPTWQEQYDLGVRYLSEGNYEEAILAFTAAIEIDPKQVGIYLGRAQAYIGSGKTEDNLNAAMVDYETALELDASSVDAWLGLADVYIRMGQDYKALEILKNGLEKNGGDRSIADKIAEIENGYGVSIEEQLQEMFQQEGALTYEDLPAVFSMRFDEAASTFGLALSHTSEYEQNGWYNGIDYALPVQSKTYESVDSGGIYQIHTTAPAGSSQMLSLDVSTALELELRASGSTGWREIMLGDSYETVLQKLGLDSIPEKYNSVHIDLYEEDGTARGYALEESGVTYNNIPTPMINVSFFRIGETEHGRCVIFEFKDGTGEYLDRVRYEDFGLLYSMIVS